MGLDLQGEVSFSVDGPGGATTGTMIGDGVVLRVHTEDPVAAWDGAVGSVSTGPRALREVADRLAGEGLSIEVSGPRGRLVVVGAEADSGVGRLLIGSRRVQLGGVGALRPLAVAQAKRTLAPHRRTVLLVSAVVAAALAVRRRVRA